jgi:2-polyprenyl-3-methyl-5-hydroxy-6-metoxy-1,4-benzoquinol methylase
MTTETLGAEFTARNYDAVNEMRIGMPKLFLDKLDWIMPFVEGRTVLDVGCIAHSVEEARDPDWLHAKISRRASSIVGVDVLREAVETLRAEGHTDLVCADVEKLDLGRQFDVILMMDVIEHLSCPGAALRRLREHLAADGVLIVTTPNPVTLLRFASLALTGRVGANPEHTCWFSEPVLRELARRQGLELVQTAFIDDSYQYYGGRGFWWPLWLLHRLATKLRPQMAETLGFLMKASELALPDARPDATSVLRAFIGLHAGMLAQSDASARVQARIARVFELEPGDRGPISAYGELVQGVRVGFEAGATVDVRLEPLGAGSSGTRALSQLRLRYSGGSRWLTLEIEVNWAEVTAADFFSITACASADREISCRVVLRLPGVRRDVDHELVRLPLLPTGGANTASVSMPAVARDSLVERSPTLLVFFEPAGQAMDVRLTYILPEFVAKHSA